MPENNEQVVNGSTNEEPKVEEAKKAVKKEKIVKKNTKTTDQKLDLILQGLLTLGKRVDALEQIKTMAAAQASAPMTMPAFEQVGSANVEIVVPTDEGEETVEASMPILERTSRRGLANAHRRYTIKGVPAEGAGFQLQARKCMVVLYHVAKKLNPEKMTITEAQAMLALKQAEKKISLNMTAWKVFTYYRARLVEEGYLVQTDLL